MRTIKNLVTFITLGLLAGAGCSLQKSQAIDTTNQPTQTVGWVENAKIPGIDQEIKAKLDTGATTASINAEILEKPDKETESGGMIKFRFLDGEGNKEVFERPIVRWVEIKSREGSDIRRPVVQMKFCVAGRWIEEEVNLADRDDFNYPILIGRNMLKQGNLVVDSTQTFTAEPECPEEDQS